MTRKLSKLTFLIGFLILLQIPLPTLTQAAGPGPQFKVQLETSKPIRALAVSPNGKYALTGLEDHTLKLWDILRGKELRSFTGHTGPITAVAFSPDSKLGLSASDDFTLRLWDLESGQRLRIFIGHKGPVNAAAFSPNGKYLISGSDDHNLILWDTNTGEALVTFTGHSGPVFSVAFSPNGKYALSGSADTTLKLWDLNDERELRTLTGHSCAVKFVAFSPDNRTAVSGSWPANHDREDPWRDHSLKLWDTEDGTTLKTMNIQSFEHIRTAALSPDGSYVLLGSYEEWDDNIDADYPPTPMELWDLNTGKVARAFGYDSLRAVAFSPRGAFILAGGDDNRLTLWNPSSGTEIKSFAGYPGTIHSVALSPDSQTLISVSTGARYDQNLIRFWDVSVGAVKHDSVITTPVKSLAFYPNGKFALDNHLSLWDLSKFDIIQTFSKLSEYDSASVAISPDGKYALSGEDWEGYANNNTLTLWNLADGKKIRTFTGHKGGITAVAFSPDGKYALSGAASDPEYQEIGPTLILWDLKTGKLLRDFQQYRENVNTIAYSPDGKYVLSGSAAQTVKLWDTKTGALIRTFTGHSGSIKSVIFAAGGKWILSAASDGLIKLWDTQSGKEIRTFTGHTRPVNSIAIAPNGQLLISGSDDFTIRWWKIATGELSATMILKPDSTAPAPEYLIWTPENFLAGTETMIKDSAYLVDGWKVYSIHKLYNLFYRPDLVAAKLQGQDITAEAEKINLPQLIGAQFTDDDLIPEPAIGLTQPETTRITETSPGQVTGGISSVFKTPKSANLKALASFLRARVFREPFQITVLDNEIPFNLMIFLIFLLITLFIGLLTCLSLKQALVLNLGTIKPTGKITRVTGWILIGSGVILSGILVWAIVFKGFTNNLMFVIALILIILESGWLLRGFRPRKTQTAPSEFQKKTALGFATFWGLLNLLALGELLGFFELHPALNYSPDLYSFAFKNSPLLILSVLILALLFFIYNGMQYILKVFQGKAEPAGKIRKITGWILMVSGGIFLGICLWNLWNPILSQTPITIAVTLILLETGWLTRGYQATSGYQGKQSASANSAIPARRWGSANPAPSQGGKWSALSIGVIFILLNLAFIAAVTFAFWNQDHKLVLVDLPGNGAITESTPGLERKIENSLPDTLTKPEDKLADLEKKYNQLSPIALKCRDIIGALKAEDKPDEGIKTLVEMGVDILTKYNIPKSLQIQGFQLPEKNVYQTTLGAHDILVVRYWSPEKSDDLNLYSTLAVYEKKAGKYSFLKMFPEEGPTFYCNINQANLGKNIPGFLKIEWTYGASGAFNYIYGFTSQGVFEKLLDLSGWNDWSHCIDLDNDGELEIIHSAPQYDQGYDLHYVLSVIYKWSNQQFYNAGQFIQIEDPKKETGKIQREEPVENNK